MIQTAGRLLLSGFMVFAGINHFTNTGSFLAQVPPFLPQPVLIVQVSGVVEVLLGVGLAALGKYRIQFGWLLAAFFTVIFPGNLAQFFTHTPAFGLDTDLARFIRLLFQPGLVVWALWSSGAWQAYRQRRVRSRS